MLVFALLLCQLCSAFSMREGYRGPSKQLQSESRHEQQQHRELLLLELQSRGRTATPPPTGFESMLGKDPVTDLAPLEERTTVDKNEHSHLAVAPTGTGNYILPLASPIDEPIKTYIPPWTIGLAKWNAEEGMPEDAGPSKESSEAPARQGSPFADSAGLASMDDMATLGGS